MWLFELLKPGSEEVVDVVIGYNFADACRRKGLDPKEYSCGWQEYID